MSGAFAMGDTNIEQTKNAKILNRKQIEKRLQGLKSQQYEKIAANLQSQNEKLKLQVKTLNEKVQELVQSRKVSKNKNPQIEQEIIRLKKELDLKYESMSYLKQQVKKSNMSDMTEEMKMKIKEQINIVNKCEKEFKELETQKEELKGVIAKNEQDLGEFIPSNEGDSKMQALKIENKELKQKITKIKEALTIQEKNSQATIGKIYELKDEGRKALAKSSRQISTSLKVIKQSSLSEINELEKQLEQLKSKKKEVEKDLVTDKIIKEAKKSRLEKEIKDSLELHKELYKRRVKGVNQLNLYESKQRQLRNHFEKEAEVVVLTYSEGATQTIKTVPKQFRKEWIGKSQGHHFNDADVIQYRGESLIKAVTIYKTPQFIVFPKFHYQSPQKQKFESEPPFQKFILKKCESKKYQSKTQAPLAGLIVSVHPPTKRVVRIQFRWADGDSTVVGWQTEGSIKFPFDIAANEKPICMFGTVTPVGKHMYSLNSLGCEIQSQEI